MKSEEFFLSMGFFFFFWVVFFYDWQNKIGSFYAIWINSKYMNFGIEIYGDGDRKPWEKKEKGNWARGLGGGEGRGGVMHNGCSYIYIFIMGAPFFASNLTVY